MSIRRYAATKDTTVTNAFRENLQTRAVNSNMGESDILEVFSIYGQATTSSVELSRILIYFPIEQILSDRTNKKIGASGSAEFILKLSNAAHSDSTPKKFNLLIHPVSSSWTEGSGLDMESYKDLGPANWLSSSVTGTWNSQGGDYLSQSYEQYFSIGTEDLEVDITSLVESWLTGTLSNNGLIIKLDSTIENSTDSYYTKKFFARGSEYFYKRPWIEARTNDFFSDDRNNFTVSSSLLDSSDNLNTLVLYNRVNGTLKDSAALQSGTLYVSLYSGTYGPVGLPLALHNSSNRIEAGRYSTGIYTASLAVNTEYMYLFDVWHNGSTIEYATGSVIYPQKYTPDFSNDISEYVVNVTNLKSHYKNNETYKFKIFARDKNWDPNNYTVSTSKIDNLVIQQLYYKIYRVSDKLDIIPYGTGSQQHTRLSYDKDGNYFNLDMSIFEVDYSYAIKFGYQYGESFVELPEVFKFRVE